jgi:hypothetical protein
MLHSHSSYNRSCKPKIKDDVHKTGGGVGRGQPPLSTLPVDNFFMQS